jgi:allantoate deiminase
MRTASDKLHSASLLLARRLQELGRVTEGTSGLTRTFLSPAMRAANELVAGWMKESGLKVREDAAGNLIGRLEATAKSNPAYGRTRTLLLGSHLDTVRNAGRFDGALGVVLPVIAAAELRRAGVELPFALEIIGFSEEEGVRFPSAYIGSKAYTGTLKTSDLKVRDSTGRTLREVLEAHSKSPVILPKFSHRRKDLVGYLEVHIEQGPVLEAEDLALGVVSSIASQRRGRITFTGKAGHAGTTPMALRADALAGAAEWVVLVETHARARPPLVATVGQLRIPGGASNVIPGEVELSLDVRDPSNADCEKAFSKLVAAAQVIAKRRKLSCKWTQTMEHEATPCAASLTATLCESVRTVQPSCPSLVSGAGHDAVVMAKHAPVAMLFVRCRAGLSHHPDEHVDVSDLSAALRATVDFIQRLAERERSGMKLHGV